MPFDYHHLSVSSKTTCTLMFEMCHKKLKSLFGLNIISYFIFMSALEQCMLFPNKAFQHLHMLALQHVRVV